MSKILAETRRARKGLGHSLNVHLMEMVAIVILHMIVQQAKKNWVLWMIKGVFRFRVVRGDSNMQKIDFVH